MEMSFVVVWVNSITQLQPIATPKLVRFVLATLSKTVTKEFFPSDVSLATSAPVELTQRALVE